MQSNVLLLETGLRGEEE